jgi:uncharacterized repeat protein (TIGR01451 family)
MKSSTFRFRFLTIIALAALLGPAQAQVFIPTTAERQALNTLIPGIVDGAGIMDTLHPAIDSLVHGSVFIPYSGPSVTAEFIGFRYLHAMTSLSISVYIDSSGSFSLNGLPADLNSLVLYSFAPINLNTLPAGLDRLWLGCLGGSNEIAVQIASMPDSLLDMYVANLNHVDWQGPFHIGNLRVNQWINNAFVLPQCSIDSLYLGCGAVSVDLSAAAIRHVFLDGCQYSQIELPTQMDYLRIRPSFYEQPICLSALPDGLDTLILENMVTGFCLPNWPTSLTNCFLNDVAVSPQDVNYCSILNSSCPRSGSSMSGHAFVDQTGDGEYDPGDLPFSFLSVHTDPNSYSTGCNSTGYWLLDVTPGSYGILPSTQYPYIQSFTPAQHTADLPEMGDVDTLNDFAVTLIPGMQDLQANLYVDPARPGFNNRLYLSCRNYGTVPVDAQLVLNYGADQSWVGSSVTPSSQGANSASWNLGSLSVGSTAFFTVDLYTGSTVALGTPLNYQLTALPTLGDETPGDNLVMPPDSVVGSFDPNDKRVSPAAMSPSEIQANDKPITYTVRFQNTGTYPAQRVVIVDTLPDGLQTASIQFLAGSHGYHWYVDHGVLYVLFENINLPDSTSDAGNSQGFVSFSLLPDSDLTIGTTIINMAHIVFDYNTPITTPPAVFHVQLATSVNEAIGDAVRVYPNPAQDRLWISTTTHSDALQYVIKDLLGRDLLHGRLRNDGAVDIAALPVGSYTITTFDQLGAHTSHFVKL